MFSTSKVSDALRNAYGATAYRVLDPIRTFELRVGQPSSALRALYRRHHVNCAAFITAWNPYSENTDDTANERAQAALAHDLRSLDCNVIAGVGEDPAGEWPGEPSVLALALTRAQTEQLGHKYRQNAVIWIAEDAIPRLILLR